MTATSVTQAIPSATQGSTLPISRQESLYYILAASMAPFTAEFGGALLWFALLRFDLQND